PIPLNWTRAPFFPHETALLPRFRLQHNGNLKGLAEKVLLDEDIHLRKENAEAGVGMVPANDAFAGEPGVQCLVDLAPGFMGEGDLGISVSGRLRGNGPANV